MNKYTKVKYIKFSQFCVKIFYPRLTLLSNKLTTSRNAFSCIYFHRLVSFFVTAYAKFVVVFSILCLEHNNENCVLFISLNRDIVLRFKSLFSLFFAFSRFPLVFFFTRWWVDDNQSEIRGALNLLMRITHTNSTQPQGAVSMCNRGCSKLEIILTVNDQSQNRGTNEKGEKEFKYLRTTKSSDEWLSRLWQNYFTIKSPIRNRRKLYNFVFSRRASKSTWDSLLALIHFHFFLSL